VDLLEAGDLLCVGLMMMGMGWFVREKTAKQLISRHPDFYACRLAKKEKIERKTTKQRTNGRLSGLSDRISRLSPAVYGRERVVVGSVVWSGVLRK
jgi:hypothetical protein